MDLEERDTSLPLPRLIELSPVPIYAPLTDADWETLFTEYGIGVGGTRVTPPRRRRMSEAELVEILRQIEIASHLEQQRLMDEWIARAQRMAGIGGPLMNDPYFYMPEIGSESPEPSRVRSPSPDLDGEPGPKRPCVGDSSGRKRSGTP